MHTKNKKRKVYEDNECHNIINITRNQYAYIRVSTKEQNIERQLLALKSFKIPKENIYCDYQSGKDFNRPEYQKLIKNLKEGDMVIIKSIDRLGRNYDEILIEWKRITKDIKADIIVLDMDLLDTRNKTGNLTGTLIADLVLQIFAYVAQTERDFMKQRQAEGIQAAKLSGKTLGRRPNPLPSNFESICNECINGNISIRQASKILGMNHSTFYRQYMKRKGVSDSRLFETSNRKT